MTHFDPLGRPIGYKKGTKPHSKSVHVPVAKNTTKSRKTKSGTKK